MLAKGFYWVDVFGSQALADFTAWRKQAGAIVRKTVEDRDDPRQRVWLLFELKQPANFLDITKTRITKPTPATAETDVTASGGAEPTPEVLDQLAEKLSVDNLASGAKTAGFLGLLALGLLFALKRK